MGFPVLASCHCIWQGAKICKVPEPKHRAIARCEVCVSMYITYILVSKSTPLAVTGPHGQLASILFSMKLVKICFYVFPLTFNVLSAPELQTGISICHYVTQCYLFDTFQIKS